MILGIVFICAGVLIAVALAPVPAVERVSGPMCALLEIILSDDARALGHG